jgi:hypothetical protein
MHIQPNNKSNVNVKKVTKSALLLSLLLLFLDYLDACV